MSWPEAQYTIDSIREDTNNILASVDPPKQLRTHFYKPSSATTDTLTINGKGKLYSAFIVIPSLNTAGTGTIKITIDDEVYFYASVTGWTGSGNGSGACGIFRFLDNLSMTSTSSNPSFDYNGATSYNLSPSSSLQSVTLTRYTALKGLFCFDHIPFYKNLKVETTFNSSNETGVCLYALED